MAGAVKANPGPPPSWEVFLRCDRCDAGPGWACRRISHRKGVKVLGDVLNVPHRGRRQRGRAERAVAAHG